MPVRFSIGQTVATPGALAALEEAGQTSSDFLHRHVNSDWGDLDADDKQANEDALLHGNRLLSSYRMNNGLKLWIITEADRSATTLLLPDEH